MPGALVFSLGRSTLLIPLAIALTACSVTPEWQRIASGAGMEVGWLQTSAYSHLVISNRQPGPHASIYIEGDGMPWLRERRIAVDPTPANPLLLRLMVADERAATYVGRPCYFGTATSASCSDAIWTMRRYSDLVVRSMCDAVNRLAAERGYKSVALVGYSGGGVLAVAMRGCVRGLQSITTIAANLDVDAWTAYHGYTPLELPRDPGVALAEVPEIHWQCSTDDQVPPAITDRYFERNPAAVRVIIDKCSHSDGWKRHLPRIQSATIAASGADVHLPVTYWTIAPKPP